jgi:hypothetical protein
MIFKTFVRYGAGLACSKLSNRSDCRRPWASYLTYPHVNFQPVTGGDDGLSEPESSAKRCTSSASALLRSKITETYRSFGTLLPSAIFKVDATILPEQ